VNVSIIGYGWLGESVAETLIEKGHRVSASTTSKDKAQTIIDAGVIPYEFALPLSDNGSDFAPLFECDVLLVMIPPQFRAGKRDYPEKIEKIVELSKKSGVKSIILVSTTAVYERLEGTITEDCTIDATVEKVALLHRAELSILDYSSDSKVVRAAGLIDEKRHPGRFFSNGRVLKQPAEPVNLVHKVDISNIICRLVEKETKSQVFNVASKTHVTKEAFYTIASRVYNDQSINIENSGATPSNRIISSERVRFELNYHFEHDDLIDWLKRGINEAK
jgi:nucleoside-diphosphate-sugar epimerase